MFHLTGQTEVICFHKEWSSADENPAFAELSVAYYSPWLTFLSVCLSNYISCLELIFYQASKHFLFELLYPVLTLSFPHISLQYFLTPTLSTWLVTCVLPHWKSILLVGWHGCQLVCIASPLWYSTFIKRHDVLQTHRNFLFQ